MPTLIWLTLVKWKKHRPAPAFFDAGFLVVDVFQSTRRGGTVLATVEYSDIRGLVTDMTFLRRGAASCLRTGVRPGWAYPLGWSRILLSVVAPLRLPWNHMPYDRIKLLLFDLR
jgi:hypothetical protein